MNTLTIKPKKPNNELLAILKQQPKRDVKQKYTVYPSDAVLEEQFDKIFNYLFTVKMPDNVRHSCKMMARLLTLGIAHHDVYELYCKSIQITEKEIVAAYNNYQDYPDTHKNKLKRDAGKYLKKRERLMKEMRELYQRQAWHLDKLDDETAEKVLDLEDSEVVLQHANDLQTYFQKPKDSKHAADMTCKEIAINLASYTGGSLYLTPQEVAAILRSRGFEESAKGFIVELVQG